MLLQASFVSAETRADMEEAARQHCATTSWQNSGIAWFDADTGYQLYRSRCRNGKSVEVEGFVHFDELADPFAEFEKE